MDVPITIGILAGFGWGAWNTVRGSGEIYFDSVTALIFLLLAGAGISVLVHAGRRTTVSR